MFTEERKEELIGYELTYLDIMSKHLYADLLKSSSKPEKGVLHRQARRFQAITT